LGDEVGDSAGGGSFLPSKRLLKARGAGGTAGPVPIGAKALLRLAA
jgi:hypothetical protein